MKKGIFSIAIAGLALIIIAYAISQHNINEEYTKTYSITATAYAFETKTNNMVRLLDKALADAYNENHTTGNCNDTGETKNKTEDLFTKIMDKLRKDYKIDCQTPDKKIIFNNPDPPQNPSLTATLEIICTYNNVDANDVKITRTLQLKLEKVGIENSTTGDCDITDVISECTEYPDFSCP